MGQEVQTTEHRAFTHLHVHTEYSLCLLYTSDAADD